MRRKLALFLVLALAGPGCAQEITRHPALAGTSRADKEKDPLTLSIVPSKSSPELREITVAEKQPNEFYVVLTNVSLKAQPVWEYWNSWGYQTLSFEFTMSDAQKIVVSRRPQDFTRNGPSTFLIAPGEHQVYPIRLDKDWETGPSFAGLAETTVTVKAIYEVPTTPESKQYKVWAGRVESGSYKFTLRHW